MSKVETAHKRMHPEVYVRRKRVRKNAARNIQRYVNISPRGRVRVLDEFDEALQRCQEVAGLDAGTTPTLADIEDAAHLVMRMKHPLLLQIMRWACQLAGDRVMLSNPEMLEE